MLTTKREGVCRQNKVPKATMVFKESINDFNNIPKHRLNIGMIITKIASESFTSNLSCWRCWHPQFESSQVESSWVPLCFNLLLVKTTIYSYTSYHVLLWPQLILICFSCLLEGQRFQSILSPKAPEMLEQNKYKMAFSLPSHHEWIPNLCPFSTGNVDVWQRLGEGHLWRKQPLFSKNLILLKMLWLVSVSWQEYIITEWQRGLIGSHFCSTI